jgi:PIN domain nuclease of toxin-antitoxin system
LSGVLLDTHIWLWRLLEPERLPQRIAALLRNPQIEIYLSPISVWETLVLARKGRLELRPDAGSWVRSALERSRPRMAPLTYAVAMAAEELGNYASRDPADRFIVATAWVEQLAVATADEKMLRFAGVETV